MIAYEIVSIDDEEDIFARLAAGKPSYAVVVTVAVPSDIIQKLDRITFNDTIIK